MNFRLTFVTSPPKQNRKNEMPSVNIFNDSKVWLVVPGIILSTPDKITIREPKAFSSYLAAKTFGEWMQETGKCDKFAIFQKAIDWSKEDDD